MSEQFYVVLPSGSSEKFFPENKTSDYVTKLPKPLYLRGNYLCGVSEITIPLSYNNIKHHDMYVTPVTLEHGHNNTYTVTAYGIKYEVAGGRYAKDHILNVIRSAFSKYTLTMKFSNATQKITLTVGKNHLVMSETLFHVLGGEFDPPVTNRLFLKATTYRALHKFDFTCGIDRFYIYLDIIEPRILGDVVTPLLTTIEVPIVESNLHFGQVLNKRISNVRYLPISKSVVDHLRIQVRDGYGKPVQFEGGKVLIE